MAKQMIVLHTPGPFDLRMLTNICVYFHTTCTHIYLYIPWAPLLSGSMNGPLLCITLERYSAECLYGYV